MFHTSLFLSKAASRAFSRCWGKGCRHGRSDGRTLSLNFAVTCPALAKVPKVHLGCEDREHSGVGEKASIAERNRG